jgi:bla regulator protein blaR1
MIALILESAARTFMLAAAAWAALRLLRVTNVVAQKIAWSIVLAAAVAMPWVVRQHWMRLPPIAIPASAIRASAILGSAISASWTTHARVPEPVLHVIAPPPEQQAIAPVIEASAVAPSPAPAVNATQLARRQWTFAQLRTLIVPAYLAVSGFLLLRLLLGLALAFRVWCRTSFRSGRSTR